jgi:hypothetical protein
VGRIVIGTVKGTIMTMDMTMGIIMIIMITTIKGTAQMARRISTASWITPTKTTQPTSTVPRSPYLQGFCCSTRPRIRSSTL